MDVASGVRDIIVYQLEVSREQLKLTARFDDDLKADSLDKIELILALEEKFSIEIPDEAAEKIATVGEAISYIEQRV